MNAQTTKSESSFGSTELTERAIYRRAVETVIWGMPAVNYYRMLQAAIANGAKANQVVYWSRPVNWKDQTLTPNPDTIYLNPLYDTTGGPVVIEIPPAEGDAAIVGSVDDAWQNALEDIGSAGVDKGKGGKFLITPPGYTEKTPEGYVALPSQTYRGFVILRSNFKSRSNADIEATVAHGKRVEMCPLGASADSTVYVDVYDKSFDATIPYDVTFFELLDHFVQAEPWLTRDKVMIDFLKTIGIEKGKPFKPDEKTKRILADAAHEAHAVIAMKYEAGFIPPFFPGTHWAVPIPPETVEGMQTAFADPNSYAIDGRAAMYHMAYFSTSPTSAPSTWGRGPVLSPGHPRQRRPTARREEDVSLHRARQRASQSVLVGDGVRPRNARADWRDVPTESRVERHGGAEESRRISGHLFRARRARRQGVELRADEERRRFEVLFRFYGPEKPLFEKTWMLPDIERIK
jgi:hypothetical protein